MTQEMKHTSAAKNLIYNLDNSAPASPHKGKGQPKTGSETFREAPFAVSREELGELYPGTHSQLIKAHHKEVNDKVGFEEFDPSVYAANRASNQTNMEASRSRNSVGAGNILSHASN